MPQLPDIFVAARPRLPRIALRAAEREGSLRAAGRLLEDAARRSRLWTPFRTARATPAQQRAVLNRLSRDAEAQTAALTSRLVTGRLPRDAWERRFREVIVPAHYAAALAGTGRTSLTPTETTEVQARIREQLGFLKRFRASLGTSQALDGLAVNRSRLYGLALWATGQAMQRSAAMRAGLDQERAVLTAEDNCRTCLDRTGGERVGPWVKIGSLVPIGQGICLTQCKCFLEYRKSG